jgi:hypothetical protein
MKIDTPEKSENCAPLHFEQSKAEPVAVVADRSWWDKNQYRVGGGLRVVARGATITSGLGVGTGKSPWRITSGALGLLAGAFLAVFGEKDKTQKDAEHSSGMNREQVGRIYHAIVATSGATAMISGIKTKRNFETISGLWTLIWSAYAALAPEDKKDAPIFDGATQAQPVGFADKEKKQSLIEEYKRHPKKLASDMLQFSALWVLWDGLKTTGKGKPDIARIVSAITLGASNYMQREMKDTDFAVTPQPTVGR